MKLSQLALFTAGALALALLSGCGTTRVTRGNPNPVAYKPHNPANVRVKVSLSTQQVYVMEGERPLLVAATCVGTAAKPTHTGHFAVFSKDATKRSGSYGFDKRGGVIVPSESGAAKGQFVGYPMPYWVEYEPAYGFHQGWVHPVPHTHGCLRLHKNVAAKFFALVSIGTPVDIAQHQPEDATIGKNLPRPTDYNDDDPPNEFMISSKVFSKPSGPLLIEQ